MSNISVKNDLNKLANDDKKTVLNRFFKTGPGEYGEGDKFLGITVPKQRQAAKKHKDLSLAEIEKLLHSNIHEYRFTALVILIGQFKKADEKLRRQIYDFYLKNTKWINNWDLVDASAYHIVGEYLIGLDNEFNNDATPPLAPLRGGKSVLYKLAKSDLLWERRIAVIAAFAFIRHNDFKDIIKLSELLLDDQHDLMHKAVGWMLREMGKRDIDELYKFLDKHALKMPRTMLRYAIEKLSEDKRQYYLKKK